MLVLSRSEQKLSSLKRAVTNSATDLEVQTKSQVCFKLPRRFGQARQIVHIIKNLNVDNF